ncbi:hypothetical protein GR212_23580 [Rhizobium lusitanum]|uniref:FAS1-like dehydratase domain-containing protein n=1 Tax=Rhizobium lusitanum TaxID=293958 RepID=A0A6L9U9B1_9HYPH|nr:MaoC family dehydratase N-terminal domain-containing protein [Rhizobium lusitanum]NEI72545.1 hypothetical protein [Rhizobium lusitanum]
MDPKAIVSLQDWIGQAIEVEDVVTPRLISSFSATLAPHLAAVGDAMAPLGLHWCLAPDIADVRHRGPDGHPVKGGFLPPAPLPRRMWAASDLVFRGTLAAGDLVRRRSTITKIEEKHGRSGLLIFVTVHHEISNERGCILDEDQTIVYREAASSSLAIQAASDISPAPYERAADVDSLLLFLYSALTFNGHRIHYDLPYAAEVEDYSGLVIHGPLQATLLLNFAALIAEKPPNHFSFRGLRAAVGRQRLLLGATPCQNGLIMEVKTADGHLSMKAKAQW